MKRHRAYHGAIDTSQPGLSSLPTMATVKEYLNTELVDKFDLIKDCFFFLVDSGCSYSCSPHKEDFKALHKLPKPVQLKGITGDILCEYGGTMCFETINDKGNICVLETPAYWNPNQTVHLFSPQAHF